MNNSTRHTLIEKGDSEFSVETNPEYPGMVFIHITSGGFRYCQGITAKEARFVGMAFFDAMDATESNKAAAVEA